MLESVIYLRCFAVACVHIDKSYQKPSCYKIYNLNTTFLFTILASFRETCNIKRIPSMDLHGL